MTFQKVQQDEASHKIACSGKRDSAEKMESSVGFAGELGAA